MTRKDWHFSKIILGTEQNWRETFLHNDKRGQPLSEWRYGIIATDIEELRYTKH